MSEKTSFQTPDLAGIASRLSNAPVGPYWASGDSIYLALKPPPHRDVPTLQWKPAHQADWEAWESDAIELATEGEGAPGFSLEESGWGQMLAHAYGDLSALFVAFCRLRDAVKSEHDPLTCMPDCGICEVMANVV